MSENNNFILFILLKNQYNTQKILFVIKLKNKINVSFKKNDNYIKISLFYTKKIIITIGGSTENVKNKKL